MNIILYALVATTLAPIPSTTIKIYPTDQACHAAIPDKTQTIKYECLPVEQQADSKQDKEMRDLFISTAEKLLSIAKEDDQ
jgi:hypothetical protein